MSRKLAAAAQKSGRRRFFVPEIIQTSAMDCGPATLKSLLEGHGIHVDYGRLREACHTDVDGTSIDTMEELANLLGLDAEQVLLPQDHILLPEASALPAIVVMRLPNRFTHFVVVWRRHGSWVQVMDPAVGRRWMTAADFLSDVYRHTMSLPATAFCEWAATNEFQSALARRFGELGLADSGAKWIADAQAAGGWYNLAALDAALRLGTELVSVQAVRRGREVEAIIRSFLNRSNSNEPVDTPAIPNQYWLVRPACASDDGEEQLSVCGAVLVRVLDAKQKLAGDTSEALRRRSPELAAAVKEWRRPPLWRLAALLRTEGLIGPSVVGFALAISALAVLLEAVVLRGVVAVGQQFGVLEQRLSAAVLVLAFAALLMLLELGIVRELTRLGRHLESRLRVALLIKIPRLQDRYVQSRAISDMAERSHAIHRLRGLPMVVGQVLRSVAQLTLTIAAIVWVNRSSAAIAIVAGCSALAIPIIFGATLNERDLRLRTQAGALGRFYLDALLGLNAVHAHRAEIAVRDEQEALLVDWAKSSRSLVRCSTILEATQLIVGFAFAGWLISRQTKHGGDPGSILLLAYWTLSLSAVGSEIAVQARKLSAGRSTMLRLLEPLGAVEGEQAPSSATRFTDNDRPLRGMGVKLLGVSVVASAQPILKEIYLEIEPGTHVAVVGPSGAGKSTLTGLLLGWNRPAAGEILVDGAVLDEARLATVRLETAWIDPGVHLWNRSLLENLLFGDHTAIDRVGDLIQDADLNDLLQRLPEGLGARLGESGRRVSGGEGQRVRLARGMLRRDARLVILDEPFRGLQRSARHVLLARTRQVWKDATLFCITHDISETASFDRVVVLADGRIIEDGVPAKLACDVSSRYHILLASEEATQNELWADRRWRNLSLEGGVLSETKLGHP